MAELLSYMANMFAIIFWMFRLYVAVNFSMGSPTTFWMASIEIEVITIFITLFAIFMIFRRNLLFASIYLATYFAYFGYGISTYEGSITSQTALSNVMLMIIGIIIALVNFVDVLFNKNRKGSGKDNKTDWFYGNDKYDREIDERADRNQYKIR